jgi:hypothetical protein
VEKRKDAILLVIAKAHKSDPVFKTIGSGAAPADFHNDRGKTPLVQLALDSCVITFQTQVKDHALSQEYITLEP